MSESSLYTTIIETTRALIVVLDAEGRIVMFNNACERLTGYRFEEVKGRRFWEFLLLPEEVEGVKAAFDDLARGQFPNARENYWITKAGERRWIEWSNSVVTDERGKVFHVVGTGIDTTEKRAAEQAAREARRRHQTLLDNIPDATWLKDENGVFLEINREAAVRCGRNRAEVIGQRAFDILPAAIAEQWTREEQQVISTKVPLHSETCRTVNGDTRWFDSVVVPVIGEEGKIIGTAGISRDITKRKLAEAALYESEANYRALFESSLDAILFTTPDGRILAANPEACRIFGRSAEELRDLGWAAVVDPTDPRLAAAREERVRTGRFKGELTLVRRDGTKFPVEVSTVAYKDINGEDHTSSIIRDITERKLAEAQRIARDAAQRDALVKEIHHRIKNNLQGTITLIQQMATAHPESENVLDAAITRLNTIASVHGLYGATGERELGVEQLVPRLVSSLQSLQGDLPLRLSVNSPVSARVGESEVVPLALIVNELIMNAIKHSRAGADAGPVEIALEGAGNGARILIRNPSGRFPKHFNFDSGAGLGTGLSLVKSMLPPEGARLRFENVPDHGGTKVELMLYPPVIAPQPSLVPSPVAAKELTFDTHPDRRG